MSALMLLNSRQHNPVGKAWNSEADRLGFKSQHSTDPTEINRYLISQFPLLQKGCIDRNVPSSVNMGRWGGNACTKKSIVAAAGAGIRLLAPDPTD